MRARPRLRQTRAARWLMERVESGRVERPVVDVGFAMVRRESA